MCVFSWNTSSLPLSETLDSVKAEYNRSGFQIPFVGMRLTTWQCSSYILPDFYYELEDKLQKLNCDIIVIGFQEDRYPGSYFHSHLLPEKLSGIGYELVKRTKMMGVGVTSCKGVFNGEVFERGVRVSIYAKKKLLPSILWEENDIRKNIGNEGQEEYICTSSVTRSKGATLSYLKLPGICPINIICCHLPFDAESLITTKMHQNYMLRQNDLNNNNICFNNIYENLVLYKNNGNDNVIYFGDFNYRLNDPRPASEVASEFLDHPNEEFCLEMYNLYDELREQMQRGNIYSFDEGIENQGPSFLPTAKMAKNRRKTDIVWNTGKYDQRTPSWCDRILYKSGLKNDIECIYYDRFDSGEAMKKSDHAGVIAVFNISTSI